VPNLHRRIYSGPFHFPQETLTMIPSPFTHLSRSKLPSWIMFPHSPSSRLPPLQSAVSSFWPYHFFRTYVPSTRYNPSVGYCHSSPPETDDALCRCQTPLLPLVLLMFSPPCCFLRGSSLSEREEQSRPFFFATPLLFFRQSPAPPSPP